MSKPKVLICGRSSYEEIAYEALIFLFQLLAEAQGVIWTKSEQESKLGAIAEVIVSGLGPDKLLGGVYFCRMVLCPREELTFMSGVKLPKQGSLRQRLRTRRQIRWYRGHLPT